MAPERIYLLADMHLKPLDAPTEEARRLAVRDNHRLAAFLSHIEGKAAGLVLLGDTFNFWFERRSKVVGDYYTALSLFKAAADNGLDIHHISGNRDFVIGEGLAYDSKTRYPGFLRLKRGFTVSRLVDFGIEPHGPRHRFHNAGKTVSCIHGDSLCTGDKLFMFLRSVLLGRIGRTAMRWGPWSAIDFFISRQQARTGVRGCGSRPGEMLDQTAVWREMAMGADLLLCGHIHSHHERIVDVDGRQCRLVALPAWLDGWHGYIENGEVVIERFEDENEQPQ